MPDTGICVLSIDVVRDDARNVDLCQRLSETDVPVTWALSSPPSIEFADALRSHTGSEVALRAEQWANDSADRRTFAQSLTSGLVQLRSAGFCPTTTVLSAGSLAVHDDLLVKQQISAVRVAASRNSPSTAGRRAAKLRATQNSGYLSSLRWGLWEAVVSADLSQSGLGTTLRTIDRLCDGGGVAIVAAPSDLLMSDAKTTSRLIDHLTRRQQEQALRLTTLAAIVAERKMARPASARSILRPAA